MAPDSKPCSVCGAVKPLHEFHRAPRGKFGRESRCKECKAARRKAEYVPAVPDPVAREARYTGHRGDTKTCTKCEETKPVSEFSQRGMGAYGPLLRSSCKACNSERAKQWHADNPGRAVSNKRKQLLWELYRLTPQDYFRILDAQGGVCAICGKPPGAAHARDMRLAVDHDHETGSVRGLLCQSCNRAIGLLGDNPVLMRRAISYLLRNKKGADIQGGQ